jgi:hypothetical protein
MSLGIHDYHARRTSHQGLPRHANKQPGLDHSGDGMNGRIKRLRISNAIKKSVNDHMPLIGDLWGISAHAEHRPGPKLYEATHTQRARKIDDFHGHGCDHTEGAHHFATITKHKKLLGRGCHDFFTQERTTKPLDERQLGVDFVSTIEGR